MIKIEFILFDEETDEDVEYIGVKEFESWRKFADYFDELLHGKYGVKFRLHKVDWDAE